MFASYTWTYAFFVFNVSHFSVDLDKDLSWEEICMYIFGAGLIQGEIVQIWHELDDFTLRKIVKETQRHYSDK